jgi:hypothetical protein
MTEATMADDRKILDPEMVACGRLPQRRRKVTREVLSAAGPGRGLLA